MDSSRHSSTTNERQTHNPTPHHHKGLAPPAAITSTFKQPSFFSPKPQSPHPPDRTPLRHKDRNQQNAPSLSVSPSAITTTRSPIAATTTSRRSTSMPIGTGGDARRQPQLAAAPKRTGPPLTPKVAARHAQSAVSPLNRTRDNDTSLAPSAPFVANITPRSGSRQGKIDSAATTPNGTPNPDRNQEAWDNNLRISVGSSTKGQDAPSQEESKFFYASDAKAQQGQTPRPPSVAASTKGPGDRFYYANNSANSSSSSINKKTTSPPTSHGFQPMLVSTPEPAASKFFYANGAPDVSRPGMATSGSGSTNSSTSRLAQSSRSTGATPASTRPMSPSKPATTPSSLKSSAMPPSTSSRPPLTSPPALVAPSAIPKENRRVSIEVPSPRSKKRHSRTGSVPTLEMLNAPKHAQSPQSTPALETASAPLSPGLAQPAMTMASLLQAVEDLAEDEDDEEQGDSSGSDVKTPGSPTKSNDPVSELVANARRERKVQDLEITNASLEAINRTLERKLRKQTAELRRFRRLSRAGRLSAVSSAVTSRATSAAISEAPVDLDDWSEDDGLDDFEGEEEEEESPEESDFESDETSTLDDPANPSEKQLARRKKDEDRLQLDLSKHQQLLVDTQKINQSIKRCLDWTEVLIKEGQKALEYKVGVSEVHFGGRVLAPPDEDDDALSSIHDDNSVIVTDMTDSTAMERPLEPPLAKSLQDNRDSGIELHVEEAG